MHGQRQRNRRSPKEGDLAADFCSTEAALNIDSYRIGRLPVRGRFSRKFERNSSRDPVPNAHRTPSLAFLIPNSVLFTSGACNIVSTWEPERHIWRSIRVQNRTPRRSVHRATLELTREELHKQMYTYNVERGKRWRRLVARPDESFATMSANKYFRRKSVKLLE